MKKLKWREDRIESFGSRKTEIMNNIWYISNFLLIACAITKAIGDRCYNCSTMIDTRCRDPFTPHLDFQVNCPMGGECQKMIYRGHVLRYCLSGPRSQESSLYEQICFEKLIKVTDTIPFLGTRTEEQLVTVCNCEEELCNRSKNMSGSFIMWIMLVFASIIK